MYLEWKRLFKWENLCLFLYYFANQFENISSKQFIPYFGSFEMIIRNKGKVNMSMKERTKIQHSVDVKYLMP